MQIRAIALGEAVPAESFEAVIHSAFESAVNLRLSNEDRLLTVLISDRYRLPQGIHINRKDVPLLSLAPGRRAACRGGVLRFEASPLSIDLRDIPVWRCPVAGLALEIDAPEVQQAWSTAWRLLNQGQRRRGSDLVADEIFHSQASTLLGQKLSRPVMELVTAADTFDVPRSTQAAAGMIGLGPGVTPSGDDLLIGFLAGLWSLSAQRPRQLSYIKAFGEGLRQIAHRTNEISRTYLYHAARGQFSSALSALLTAVGNGRELESSLQEAMRVGHSSGMDSVTGLLVGLAVWNDSPPSYPVHLQKEKQNSGKSYGHFAASD